MVRSEKYHCQKLARHLAKRCDDGGRPHASKPIIAKVRVLPTPSRVAGRSTLGCKSGQNHDGDHRRRHTHIDASLPPLGQIHPSNCDSGAEPQDMNCDP